MSLSTAPSNVRMKGIGSKATHCEISTNRLPDIETRTSGISFRVRDKLFRYSSNEVFDVEFPLANIIDLR